MSEINYSSDYFGGYADNLRKEFEELHESQPVQREEKPNPYVKLYEKMSYKWRPEDAAALAQIRETTSYMIDDVFNGALAILDEMYEEVRVPIINEHGVVKLDENRRPLYEKDSRGNFKENWDLLTGQDIEVALMKLARDNVIISQRVSELYLEANFAKLAKDDDWYEAYEKPVDGHSADRQAYANRNTREMRYLAYFRYYLWVRAESLQKEIRATTRLLERILQNRMWRKSDS